MGMIEMEDPSSNLRSPDWGHHASPTVTNRAQDHLLLGSLASTSFNLKLDGTRHSNHSSRPRTK